MKSKVRKFLALFLIFFLLQVSLSLAQEGSQPPLTASSAILIEAKTGQILLGKNAKERRSIASLTKIMTAILALEKGGLKKTVTVSKEATDAGGSELYLTPGEARTVEELLYAVLLKSANDASFALAEATTENLDQFISFMNEKAKDLGAKDTHFTNPHGLQSDNHYSTAFDLSLISRYAFKNPKFREIVKTKEYTIPWPGNPYPRKFQNHNKLLFQYPYANGVKTGYTNAAGHCLVASATNDGVTLISVVLGAPGSTNAYDDSLKLLEYGFNNFKPLKVVEKGENFKKLALSYSKEKLKLKAAASFQILRAEGTKVKVKVAAPKSLELPVSKNQKLGKVNIYEGGKKLGEVALIAEKSVAKPAFFQKVIFFLKSIWPGAFALEI